jgi:hypothetical protein
LSQEGLDISISNVHKSYDGRIIFVNIVVEEKTLSIINIYANNLKRGMVDLPCHFNAQIHLPVKSEFSPVAA